ncbi:MAG: hypothetical protein PUA90_05610 [bacterium]|nr:hypothetical protein [bacterium]
MKKNKKIKRKLKRKFKILLWIILIIFFSIVIKKLFIKKEYVSKIKFNNKEIIIEVLDKDTSCIISDTTPTLHDNWIKNIDKKCHLNYINNSNIYINVNDEIINLSKDTINYIDIEDENKIYIAINDSYEYIKMYVGDKNKLQVRSTNKDVAYIDDNGKIIGLNKGTAKIYIEFNDKIKEITVVVTDLITKKPNIFDHNKEALKCNQFTSDENDLLDNILESRIKSVGYQTRAGAVEAARFLTLEFPYKINYFNENGRLTTNGIDAEGRYYHIGLYLHESRFSSISNSTSEPKIWGCSLYSTPQKKYLLNGLDCSGFVSWTLLNAGFDIKDIGAGFKDGDDNDLTDYGDIKKLNNSLKISEIKVGDLLHSAHVGGHIAMIVGIENDTFYVAQALWNNAPYSLTKRNTNSNYVQITQYNKNEIINVFDEVILMDKYYEKDGKLTNMW